jgi:hydroxyacylglutathione hydrolase
MHSLSMEEAFMQLLADGVWQLRGVLPHAINIYLLRDVLVDTGTRWGKKRVLQQLRHRPLRMVALTHCHPDHQGLANVICESRKIPLACHEIEVSAMEGRGPMQPENWILRLGQRCWSGPPYRVEHILREGDEIAGFRVIHTPGHTPGHVILFRDKDRIALGGDLLSNFNFVKMSEELVEPPPFFSWDVMENRRSIVKLAALNPSMVCFGHGPPLRDVHKLQGYAERTQRRLAASRAV